VLPFTFTEVTVQVRIRNTIKPITRIGIRKMIFTR